MSAPLWLMEAGVGLVFGLVYAIYTISQELLARDPAPSQREVRYAIVKFMNALVASPAFAAVLTDPLVKWTKGGLSWPAVSATLGISINALWPLILAGASDEVKDRVKDVFKAIFGGGSK